MLPFENTRTIENSGIEVNCPVEYLQFPDAQKFLDQLKEVKNYIEWTLVKNRDATKSEKDSDEKSNLRASKIKEGR